MIADDPMGTEEVAAAMRWLMKDGRMVSTADIAAAFSVWPPAEWAKAVIRAADALPFAPSLRE